MGIYLGLRQREQTVSLLYAIEGGLLDDYIDCLEENCDEYLPFNLNCPQLLNSIIDKVESSDDIHWTDEEEYFIRSILSVVDLSGFSIEASELLNRLLIR